MSKRTPLYPAYEEHGAKTIDFGGWDLPVQFSSIIGEHQMTRTKAALFDVSHMGEVSVQGADSLQFLQKLITNDVSKLVPGRAQYTFMCNENGGTIDDFLIYMLKDDDYLLVVNAANIEKDVRWLNEHLEDEEVQIKDESDVYALLAIQGPLAETILQKVTREPLDQIKPFRFKQEVRIDTIEAPVLLSRTGYTGEDGFEIYITKEHALPLWKKLLEIGGNDIVPAGLGARDSLRFEAGLPLYGQELSNQISPLEAGLHFAVKTNKTVDFIGKQALKNQVNNGVERQLVGIEMIEKGIPRTNYDVLNQEDEKIGFITTGTKSPTLNKAIGFALLNQHYTEIGTEVYVQVRKRKVKGHIIPIPFYKR